MEPLIVGFAASHRNARAGQGARGLVDELLAIPDRVALDDFISQQAKVHLDAFVEAGRRDGKPFDEIYRELKRAGGRSGLSNSEICLAAALWGAQRTGARIDHVSLADHFSGNGGEHDLDKLAEKILQADGIIISTPVYFGDRSSLSEQLIQFIRQDDRLRQAVAGKIYAGLAVGAKRNGGQETTLIYQMLDMVGLGMSAVGNDSDTTAQYGGTAHAGDIGTMPRDTYGINTAIGTGARIAKVSQLRSLGSQATLTDRPIAGIWVLQDRDSSIEQNVMPLFADLADQLETRVTDFTQSEIRPCIACDICPTEVGPDEDYRCIIALPGDGVKRHHADLLAVDILMPAVYCPTDSRSVVSVYQRFVERTRYLRRGDYVFTDHVVVPLILAEVGNHDHMDVRMLTSLMRHQAIMRRPVVVWLHQGQIINLEEAKTSLAESIMEGRNFLGGRLLGAALHHAATTYHPVGYVLSQAKDREKETIDKRETAATLRQEKLTAAALRRLAQ